MSDVIWEDLPPKATGRREGSTDPIRAVVAALPSRPWCWARIATVDTTQHAASLAGRVRAGRYGADFEAAARKVDGEFRVYARYIGGAS